jgi:hypothetical protein
MRMFLCSCAAVVGAGGYAVTGAAPDFDRTINRSPEAVYAAFSAVAPEVRETTPRTADTPELIASIEKEPNREIRLEVLADGDEVVGITVNFEPAKDGAATRITAELDIDQRQMRSLHALAAGQGSMLPPGNVPEAVIDMAFNHLMQEMVSDVEAGRALDFGSSSGRAWESAGAPSPAAGSYEAREQQRRAARPMTRPAPMVDPNQAARDYMRGGEGNGRSQEGSGGWGR